MKTIKEFVTSLREKGIEVFSGKKPGITNIVAKIKCEAILVEEIAANLDTGNIQVWESEFNGKWYTFIKDKKAATEEIRFKEQMKAEDEEFWESMDSKHWEMDAYDYDGDPDKFDDWREGSGY